MIEDEAAARAWVAALPHSNALVMDRLDRLCSLLATENDEQNLVARSSLAHVWRRHIADSAQLLLHVPRETGSAWLDLGTGAGFPGLVMAVLCPASMVTMVESRARRAAWLRRVSGQLGLTNAAVVESRLERVETMTFDVISARAFAPLDKLLQLSFRFSTTATQWLLPKGRSAAHELSALQGWRHAFHVEQSITDPEAGIIVGNSLGRKARP